MSRGRLFVAVVTTLAVAACSAPPRSVVTDLLARRPDAVAPTTLITPGDEATRQLLEAGFSLDGDRLVMRGSERAVFSFQLADPGELGLTFHGQGTAAFSAPAFVNDVPLGPLAFPAGAGEAVLALPAAHLHAGANAVAVELPREAASGPAFRLSSIRIGSGSEPVRWTGGEVPALLQAVGSEASWLVEPAGDRLELAGRLLGCAGATCAVELRAETDHAAPRVLWRAEASSAEAPVAGEVALARFRGEPLRLTARFRSGPSSAALTWTRLRVTRAASVRRGAPVQRVASASRPNLLVFLVDTLRRDHLSLYGYPRATSPELQRLGAEAVVFEDARTQSSWTSPAVASLFTGEHPSAHGISDHHSTLAPGFSTLAEFLKERGYRTAALVVNPGVGKRGGFEQGFDEYRFLPLAGAEQVVREALAWAGSGPWFLYLHLMDPHYPYTKAPAPFDALARAPEGAPVRPDALSIAKLRRRKVVPTPAELEYLRSLYDSEVAYVDGALGRLVRGLRRRGLYDRTLIVFVSDHGEEFADHGSYYHGHTLYDELVRAALVVKPAGRFAGRSVRTPVQSIDVYPTIADVLGAPRADLPGRSLLPLFAGRDDEPPPRPVFSETELRSRLRSVVMGGHKLVLEDRRPAGLADLVWLYDLAADPAERKDERLREPVRAAHLAATLRRHLEATRQRAVGGGRRVLDEETLRELQALGYVDAGSD